MPIPTLEWKISVGEVAVGVAAAAVAFFVGWGQIHEAALQNANQKFQQSMYYANLMSTDPFKGRLEALDDLLAQASKGKMYGLIGEIDPLDLIIFFRRHPDFIWTAIRRALLVEEYFKSFASCIQKDRCDSSYIPEWVCRQSQQYSFFFSQFASHMRQSEPYLSIKFDWQTEITDKGVLAHSIRRLGEISGTFQNFDGNICGTQPFIAPQHQASPKPMKS